MRASTETSGTDRAAIGWVILGRSDDRVTALVVDVGGDTVSSLDLPHDAVAEWVREREARWSPRWVWHDTARWYPALLAAGVRVARCHDLRLCRVILRGSTAVAPDAEVREVSEWDAPPTAEADTGAPALFDLAPAPAGPPVDAAAAGAEFARQRAAVDASPHAGRLRLLLAAESTGALIAVELHEAGLPWDEGEHERILIDELGAPDPAGGVPARIAELARQVRAALGDPAASLDSQPKLLRALHRAGVAVESTSKWELAEHRHPVIEPLLEYKRLMRLSSSNGRAWRTEWVRDGRFRPVFVPGGVVTGRWASSGGGALQLPKQLRAAVRADAGWELIVADVAQLEPRMLAAMAGDLALAQDARGRDLYAGIVDRGAVATRAEGKIAMLGAMYGATSGQSGRLMPRLRRTYPRAMGLVDDAARVGEDGGVVTTWLGRSSPPPDPAWTAEQARASEASATPAEQARARRRARDRGRFTRNFVVQGTAAEWALVWLADLRVRLAQFEPVADAAGAPRSGPVFGTRAHLAFFLHDEVIVHAPREQADAAARAIVDAAATATRLLFGAFPIDVPVEVAVGPSAVKA